MTFNDRDYNRQWMKKDRARKTWTKDINRGHCPVCSMLLKSKLHINCPFLDKEDKTKPF